MESLFTEGFIDTTKRPSSEGRLRSMFYSNFDVEDIYLCINRIGK